MAIFFLAISLAKFCLAFIPPLDTFSVVVGLPHQNIIALEDSFWGIATPSHAQYLQHLSLAQLANIVGASNDTIQNTTRWLVALHCIPASIRVSALRDTITASFPVGIVLSSALWHRGLPLTSSHPAKFDFILRRNAGSSISKSTNSSFADARSFRMGAGVTGASIDTIKKAYGIPNDLMSSNDSTLQMVWGPGTFGYSSSQLASFSRMQCPLLNLSQIVFDTDNHGIEGGANFGEGQLDVSMISTFGLNIKTLVSNTNTSASTEQGNGFGEALLDFIVELSGRQNIPQVLSMSLGSLSAYSCDLLCSEAAKKSIKVEACTAYLQKQFQVCMYLTQDQTARIDRAFQILGTRGTSIFASSGDGGSHFSFGPFPSDTIGRVLNEISCDFQMPVYPTASPYVISVGGESWINPKQPTAWSGSGSGFSGQFARPAYQESVVAAYLAAYNSTALFPDLASFNNNGRAYPDLSALSQDGTSQSCPIIAGIFSLINDHRFNAGLPALGFLGPRLYQVAQQYPGVAFADITKGNSKTACSNGFPATVGWDAVTGFGRPVWAGMLLHFGVD